MKTGLPFSILVVEDDEDDRVIIDEAFIEIGFGAEVKKFMNGQGLFQYLKDIEPTLYPSLIVLDDPLSGIDTETILAVLKTSHALQHIPVVIYSTGLSPSRKQTLLQAGAYACFEKGDTLQDIIDVVEELTKISRSKLAR